VNDRPALSGSLFSIGHSNHSLEAFLGLLRANGIELVVDVRSHPVSRFSPHFNHGRLPDSLKREGVAYVFLGRELGGRPADARFYDEEGHVLYGRLSRTAAFRRGIAELEAIAREGRPAAIMCAEEDPSSCHRHLLIGPALARKGIALRHIRKAA